MHYKSQLYKMGTITQNMLKLQIPYYHLLNQWLLGATNGNQGQAMMDLQSSKTVNHLK